MINFTKQYFTILLVTIFLIGCGPESADTQRLCDAQIRKAVVDIQSSTSAKDPNGETFKNYRSALRNLLLRCELSDGDIAVTGNTSVSVIELNLMAGLNENVISQLDSAESITDPEKASLLFVAARFGDVDILKEITNLGIDARLTDDYGNNAISEFIVAPTATAEKIEFLVQSGVDPLSKNVEGLSALDGAVLAADESLVRSILSTVSAKDEDTLSAVRYTLELATDMESPTQPILEAWLSTANP